MEMKELYKRIEEIGCFTFSTISESGEVHSRIAHFNGFDENGLYLRTMVTKPYYRQLIKTGKLTVCGMTDSRVLSHNDDGSTNFPPSYTLRLVGKVKNVPDEVIKERAQKNKMLLTAVQDMERYPMMQGANFIMYAAKGEIYDVDFDLINRDHKLKRERFSFGGIKFNEAGPQINNNCIACGLCMESCTFKAIEAGDVYKINPKRCDDCGDCINVCKFDAIDASKEF